MKKRFRILSMLLSVMMIVGVLAGIALPASAAVVHITDGMPFKSNATLPEKMAEALSNRGDYADTYEWSNPDVLDETNGLYAIVKLPVGATVSGSKIWGNYSYADHYILWGSTSDSVWEGEQGNPADASWVKLAEYIDAAAGTHGPWSGGHNLDIVSTDTTTVYNYVMVQVLAGCNIDADYTKFAPRAFYAKGEFQGEVPVSGVSAISGVPDHPIAVGASGWLSAGVIPSSANNKTITWSSNNACVTIDENTGAYTAMAEGSATITATSAEGGFTATATITVENIAVTDVNDIGGIPAIVEATTTGTASSGVVPSYAANTGLVWSSSDSGIFSIEANSGAWTAVAAGNATVKVQAAENGDIFKTFEVTVLPKYENVSLLKPVKANANDDRTALPGVITNGNEFNYNDLGGTLQDAVTYQANGYGITDDKGDWYLIIDLEKRIDIKNIELWSTHNVAPGAWEYYGSNDDAVWAGNTGDGAHASWTLIGGYDNMANIENNAWGNAKVITTIENAKYRYVMVKITNTLPIGWQAWTVSEVTVKGASGESVDLALENTATGDIYPDTTVTYNLNASNASDAIKDITVVMSYDTSVMTFLASESTVDSNIAQIVGLTETEPGKITLNASGTEAMTLIDGAVATLKFQIKNDAAGKSAQIIFVDAECDFYDTDDWTFTADMTDSVEFTVGTPVTGVEITDGAPVGIVEKGTTGTLVATVSPADATNTTVTWESDNTNAVTVNATTGEWEAVGVGSANITVTSGYDAALTDTVTIEVTVSPAEVEIEGEETIMVEKEDTGSFTAIVYPDDAVNQTVIWSSDDTSIVSIDANTGSWVAVGAGDTTVRATVDGTDIVDTVTIRVVDVLATDVAISDAPTADVEKGTIGTLTAVVTPTDATDASVTWSSDNTEVITIDPATGTWEAVGVGTATVTVTALGGVNVTDTATITVIIAATGITIDNDVDTMEKGNTNSLTATITPADATNNVIVWSSSDPSVIEVNASTGEITSVGAGTAAITATVEGTDISDSVTITVVVPATGITIDNDINTMEKGNTNSLSATITPADTTDNVIVWSSSDPSVIEVNASTGEITSVGVGTATITATVEGTDITDTITITVVVTARGVEIKDAPTENVKVGATGTLTAVTDPLDVTDEAVWSSSDPNVVTVDATGAWTAVGAGAATITVTVGDVSNSVDITVVPAGVEVALGDLDKDGKANITDALAIFKHIAGKAPLTGDALKIADVDANDSVNITDALAIFKHIAGKAPITGTVVVDA